MQDHDVAALDLKQALALKADKPEYHANLGLVLESKKDWDSAIAEYNQAIRLDPQLYWAYIYRGNARYHSGDLVGMVSDYETAFHRDPNRSVQLIVRFLAKLFRRESDGAIHSCEVYLRKYPGDCMTFAKRALLLLLGNREEQAEADLEQFQRLAPQWSGQLEMLVNEVRRARLSIERIPITCPADPS